MRTAVVPLALVLAGGPPAARADDADPASSHTAQPLTTDDYLSVEVPMALGERLGSLPAVAVFRDNGFGAIGVRLRAGLFASDADMPGAGVEPVGILGIVLRRHLSGGWIEVGGGAAGTQHGIAVAVELAAGWMFHAGRFDIGPSARYLRVDERRIVGGAVDTLLLGAEVSLGRGPKGGRRGGLPESTGAKVTAPVATMESCKTDIARCERLLAEAVEAGLVQIGPDRTIIDIHALLAPSSERMHASGTAVVAAIAHRITQRPNWARVKIEGYAELAATDFDNWNASQRWTSLVRTLMIDFGLPADRVEAIGFGNVQQTGSSTSGTQKRPPNRIELVISYSADGP